MRVSEFSFDLPSELIAQTPSERGTSRLLVLGRADGSVAHRHIADLPELLREGDLLVVNDTRVFPARLLGARVPTGGAVECLLLGRLEGDRWEALVHPGQKLRPRARVIFEGEGGRTLHGEILDRHFHGRRTIRLWTEDGTAIDDTVDAIGHVPLPPYIHRGDTAADRERYQTVYAAARGSVAAPTAGLHFSEGLLAALERRGVLRTSITLHVGYGTFQPVRVEDVEAHTVHPEWYVIGEDAAAAINRARADHRRIVAVGTTTTRALESAAAPGGVTAGAGWTDLYIHPPFTFQVIDGLITNFHLPQSSLLMLVSAFGGRGRVLAAYRQAVEHRYRFYSYGDAMLIV